jgi:hypothetical protein
MPTYRIEGQIYEAATPDEAYAKHDQAIKGGAASPALSSSAPAPQENGIGTGQMLAQAVVNFPRSAYELGKSTFEAVTSPIETGKAVVELGSSVLGKMGVTNANPEMADRVGKFYTDRYGSVENAKKTFASDPAGFLADASTILTGGGAAVRAVPSAMKRTGGAVAGVGQKMQQAAEMIDPLSVALKGAKAAGKGTAAVLGFTTGTGTRAVEEAAKAGYRGGEQGQAFVNQMRGTAPVTDVVETIKPAIASLREQKSRAYKQGMAGVTKDKTVLKFDDIDNAIGKVKGRGYFEGKSKDPAAASAWQELKTVVDDWKSGDPAVYHTVEGVDALKQAVGSIRDSLPYNTPARNAANEVYSAIRGEITRQAPDYARVMSEYETASDLLNEISTTLSQNPKASIDTQVRKLQSILRNNANTNYGRRVELGEMLADEGASNLFPQLAGQAMSSWSPRGLSGALAGAGALYSTVPTIAQGLTPTGALQLASTSPRVVGEATYAAGKIAGKPAQLAQLLAKHGDKLAQSNPQMAMAVDIARRAGGKVNPQTARLLAYQLAQFERATEE